VLYHKGARIELWALNYAGMSQGDAWRLSPISNPAYPGKTLEEAALELSTGSTMTLAELKALNPGMAVDPEFPIVDGFEYYREEVAPTFALKES